MPRDSSSLYLTANHQVVISPDGRNIVYLANRNGQRQLFLRPMGEPDARPIDGTDEALTAFFSPDGRYLVVADEHSNFMITAVGADYVEEKLPANRTLYKLLKASEFGAMRSELDEERFGKEPVSAAGHSEN